MPSVIFSHTKEQEREYLDQLFEERQWFDFENFDVFFPKEDSIENAINNKDESFDNKVTWLRKEWRKIEGECFKIIEKFQHKDVLSHYKCHVSQFGPEGKYTRPDMLFVRLRTEQDKHRIIETIGHELLHLVFAPFFEVNKLEYAEREGMIDALILQSDLCKLFPCYEKQSVGVLRPKLLKAILK